MRSFSLFAFLLLGSLPAISQPAQQQGTPSILLPGSYWENDRHPPKIGDVTPNWDLPVARESPLAKKGTARLEFKRWRGQKNTIVVFWAFWCDTWKDVTTFFGEMRPQLDKRGVSLVVISVDASQQPVARPAWAAGKLWFPVVIDEKSEVTSRYGVRRVPTILLIAPQGKVKATWEGLPSKKVLLRELNK